MKSPFRLTLSLLAVLLLVAPLASFSQEEGQGGGEPTLAAGDSIAAGAAVESPVAEEAVATEPETVAEEGSPAEETALDEGGVEATGEWPEAEPEAAALPSWSQENTPPAGSSAAGVLGLLLFIVGGVFSILMLIASWRVVAKSGQPGWAVLIPIYQLIVFCKAAGKPAWWFVLLLIPGVNLIISLLLCLGLAAKFGKGGGFGTGLWLLPVVFLPILGFGSAVHEDGPPPPEQPAPRGGGSASSKEIPVFGVLTILAGLCFMVLLVLQIVEFMHYGADPSAWNPKP